MTLVKFEPWKEFETLSERMRKFFDDMPMQFSMDSGAFAPKIDISEDENALIINAELPGVKKEDVKVSIQDNIITIKGEKKLEEKEEKKNYFRIERSFGSFCRSFTLPVDVNVDKIKAEHKDGILNITLPKLEKKPVTQKLIEIQ